MDFYRCTDGFYGHDNPARWPQPLNHNNVYLAWIPARPTSDNHCYMQEIVMWEDNIKRQVEYQTGARSAWEGVLNIQVASQLTIAVTWLKERMNAFTGRYPLSSKVALLSEFSTNMTTSLHRIALIPMKFRDILCGLAEVQRAWLYSVGVMDFVETYESKATALSSDGLVLSNPCLGAFVWNNQDASKLFNVGIPLYYVCSYNAFSTQIAAHPSYPVILPTSQAGCNAKFAAIRQALIACFDVVSTSGNLNTIPT
ncbi:hypothetical protein V5O48_012164 [Marasmius crinis-equi]|uniref:Uncharacterized protein n=1 Tax=Marasmius crinis-equi TaxID=585013 RepID=A0ABR3F3J9_9AGAR